MKYCYLKILIPLFFYSCNEGNYSVSGTIKSIEMGKDGFNSVIVNKQGKEFDITISRNDMGIRYKELKIGDQVRIYGDSSQYGDRIDIHATKIVE